MFKPLIPKHTMSRFRRHSIHHPTELVWSSYHYITLPNLEMRLPVPNHINHCLAFIKVFLITYRLLFSLVHSVRLFIMKAVIIPSAPRSRVCFFPRSILITEFITHCARNTTGTFSASYRMCPTRGSCFHWGKGSWNMKLICLDEI
jgi:hypothetical protein